MESVPSRAPSLLQPDRSSHPLVLNRDCRSAAVRGTESRLLSSTAASPTQQH
jgi:hypothetical protein